MLPRLTVLLLQIAGFSPQKGRFFLWTREGKQMLLKKYFEEYKQIATRFHIFVVERRTAFCWRDTLENTLRDLII